jgi:hypothetical protein
MRDARLFILAALTVLLVGAVAGAQPAESPPRPGYGWGAGRGFDAGTVETIEGEILEVTSTPCPGWRRARGVHLTVETGSGPVSVSVGPQWYLQRKEVAFAAGEQVTVTGSRVSLRGQPALVATEVRRGESVLRLREADGAPAWAGWSQGTGWAGRGGRMGRGRGVGPGCRRAGAPPPAP